MASSHHSNYRRAMKSSTSSCQISFVATTILISFLIKIFNVNTAMAGTFAYQQKSKVLKPQFPKFLKFPLKTNNTSDSEHLFPNTNIEKPPISTRNWKPKPSDMDDAGITIFYTKTTEAPTKSIAKTITKKNSAIKTNLSSKLKIQDILSSGLVKFLRKIRSIGMDKISTALSFNGILNGLMGTQSGDGVSTGRYTHGFMDGAMVPMSFLLMAAFIMDILQRLFPLPYATFVHQAQHRAQVVSTTAAPSTMKPAPELDRFQLNTPIGSVGLETNEDFHSKFHHLLHGYSK